MGNYYSREEVDKKLSEIDNSSNVYNKNEINSLFQENQKLYGYTKTDSDLKYATLDSLNFTNNNLATNYYTKIDSDLKYANINSLNSLTHNYGPTNVVLSSINSGNMQTVINNSRKGTITISDTSGLSGASRTMIKVINNKLTVNDVVFVSILDSYFTVPTSGYGNIAVQTGKVDYVAGEFYIVITNQVALGGKPSQGTLTISYIVV
jgi:hypothetical protein